MVEETFPIQWILPIIVSIAMPPLLIIASKFVKTADSTLTGTIRLETVSTEVSGMKDEIKQGFDKLEALINKKDDDNRKEFNKIWEVIRKVTATQEVQDYRLNTLDSQKTKSGGGKSPI